MCAPSKRRIGIDSLTERAGHLFDCRLATLVLGDLLILTAPAGRDLADQTEVAALKLARGELLGGDGRTAPPSALRSAGRRRCLGAIARSGRAAATATGHSRPRTAAGGFAKRLQTPLELVDLGLHLVYVTKDLARRNAPVVDHPVNDIRGLS